MGKTFVEGAVGVFTMISILTVLSGCATPTQPVPAGTEIDTATQTNVVQPSVTPTATATPVLTPTEASPPTPIPEKYPIDMAKLKNVPKSIADLEANPVNYLQAPDPLTDKAAFFAWWEKLKTNLGDITSLKPDITVVGIASPSHGGRMTDVGLPPNGSVLLDEPDFFYLSHEGVSYPVVLFVTQQNSGQVYTADAFILYDGGDVYTVNAEGQTVLFNSEGRGVLSKLVPGTVITTIGGWEQTRYGLPKAITDMINTGLDGSGPGNQLHIRPGVILTK